MAVFGGLGSSYWTAKHWPGRKVPEDKVSIIFNKHLLRFKGKTVKNIVFI